MFVYIPMALPAQQDSPEREPILQLSSGAISKIWSGGPWEL